MDKFDDSSAAAVSTSAQPGFDLQGLDLSGLEVQSLVLSDSMGIPEYGASIGENDCCSCCCCCA